MFSKVAFACAAMFMASTSSSAATLVFDFSTNEPFVGGDVKFTLEAEAPLPSGTFIEASALSSFSPGVARVRFQDTCFTFVPGGSSSVACDIVEVIVNTSFGSTQVVRLLQDGALSRIGRYTNLNPASTPAVLTVSAPAVAVPEPATWAMMIAGFALLGAASRRSRSAPSSEFTSTC
jgi:hypothetical protein